MSDFVARDLVLSCAFNAKEIIVMGGRTIQNFGSIYNSQVFVLNVETREFRKINDCNGLKLCSENNNCIVSYKADWKMIALIGNVDQFTPALIRYDLRSFDNGGNDEPCFDFIKQGEEFKDPFDS